MKRPKNKFKIGDNVCHGAQAMKIVGFTTNNRYLCMWLTPFTKNEGHLVTDYYAFCELGLLAGLR